MYYLHLFTPDVGYTKEGQNMIVYPTFYIDFSILTYLDICPGMGMGITTVLEYMYVYMYCLLLTRMHEDMLFYRGSV